MIIDKCIALKSIQFYINNIKQKVCALDAKMKFSFDKYGRNLYILVYSQLQCYDFSCVGKRYIFIFKLAALNYVFFIFRNDG